MVRGSVCYFVVVASLLAPMTASADRPGWEAYKPGAVPVVCILAGRRAAPGVQWRLVRKPSEAQPGYHLVGADREGRAVEFLVTEDGRAGTVRRDVGSRDVPEPVRASLARCLPTFAPEYYQVCGQTIASPVIYRFIGRAAAGQRIVLFVSLDGQRFMLDGTPGTEEVEIEQLLPETVKAAAIAAAPGIRWRTFEIKLAQDQNEYKLVGANARGQEVTYFDGPSGTSVVLALGLEDVPQAVTITLRTQVPDFKPQRVSAVGTRVGNLQLYTFFSPREDGRTVAVVVSPDGRILRNETVLD